MKYFNITIVLLTLTISFGCAAKSGHVDELTGNVHRISKELLKNNPDNITYKEIERDAYMLAKESSAIVDDDMITKGVGIIAGIIGKLIGFDLSTYATMILGLLGVGGGAKVYANKKRKVIKDQEDRDQEEKTKKKMSALARMNPAEAENLKDVI